MMLCYSFYDRDTDTYSTPFFVRTAVEAVRAAESLSDLTAGRTLLYIGRFHNTPHDGYPSGSFGANRPVPYGTPDDTNI